MIAPLRYSNPRTIPPGLLIRSANLHLNGSIIKEKEGKKETKEKKAVEGLSGKKRRGSDHEVWGGGSGSDLSVCLSVYGARNQINATTRHIAEDPSEGGVRQL